MKLSIAMARADELRPSTASEEQKAAWVCELDAQLAEMMAVPVPENQWPQDRELLMPPPHEELYQLYLCCKLDYYNQEMDLYANDIQLYNAALAEAQAWWRRHHRPPDRRSWEVMR